MTRILAALLSLLVIATAAAKPPVDYILLCDAIVIGTVRHVDGEFHVAVLEGAEACVEPRALSVVGDRMLEVTFDWADGVLTVKIGDDMVVVAAEIVPQQAIDGMRGAAENRAAAAELRGQGQETAAAKRAKHQPELPELPVSIDPPVSPIEGVTVGQPELPWLPELPVLPHLPDAAGGRRR